VAHQCAVNQLERLESEEAEERNSETGEESSSTTESQTPTTGIVRLQTGEGADRMLQLFDDQPVVPPATSGSGKQKRASTWVKDLIFDNSPLPSGFRRQTWGDGISSMDNAQQAYYLVQKWTDKPSNMINPSMQTTNSPQQGPQDISTAKVEEHVQVQGNSHESTQEFMASQEGAIESALSDLRKGPLVRPPGLHSLSPAMYMRALFDYEADDRTSLSFHEGDVILVINQAENGWWDGVIRGVRGWAPSNYFQVIEEPSEYMEEEAEEQLEESDDEYYDEYDDESDEEYEEGEAMITKLHEKKAPLASWIPQATPDGRLFYYNTETGESSMELPSF